MSKLRKYLATMEERNGQVDIDRVLDEWDIPLDENVTAFEAAMWLNATILYNEEIVMSCVMEGLDCEEWDAAVEFVWLCLRRGVIPHEYVNLLIEYQQTYNEFYSSE